MAFSERGGLRVFTFEIFERGIVHGLYTRLGGVSPQPWDSLNLGGTVGDERAHVIENRRRIFASSGRAVETIFDVWQVHGTTVIATDAPRPLDSAHQQADIILTDHPEITLFMRFADCVPVMLYDPVRRVVSLYHAGWKGTLSKAGLTAVRALIERYGSRPENILAGIGPSICAGCYEVGPDVAERARNHFDGSVGLVLKQVGERSHLDLWEANRLALMEGGVSADHIQTAGLCTAEDTHLWYSHRAENGKTGRFGALIALEG